MVASSGATSGSLSMPLKATIIEKVKGFDNFAQGEPTGHGRTP
jgi:hypothetical protein